MSTPAAGEIIEPQSLAAQSLETEATKVLTEKDMSTLRVIAKAIGKDGMTVEEACQLSNVPHERFKRLCIEHPVVQRIISLKELEYKQSILRSLSSKARSGDDKIAQWLLERRYPEEFGSKKGGGGGVVEDPMSDIIKFVQSHGDSSPLVVPRSPDTMPPPPGTNVQTDRSSAPLSSSPSSNSIARLQQFLS